jgi:hypothetical protein
MGVVEPPWGQLWLALAIAAFGNLVFQAMDRLAPQRGQLRLLNERGSSEKRGPNPPGGESRKTASGTPDPAVPQPAAPARTTTQTPKAVPVHVIVSALIFGAFVVGLAALLMRPASQPGANATKSDSAARADTALDIGWRSGRMDGNDCVGTFEVKRGAGTPARFVAFVLDSSGAVMAQDSGGVAAAVTGVLVDFRFRKVACSKIADWQLQALTPK